MTAFLLIRGSMRLVETAISVWKTRKNTVSRLANRFAMISSPKIQPISILLWNQNRQPGFEEAVHSLLSLNYPDYELIIIDDGSTDATLESLTKIFSIEPVSRVFKRSLVTGPIHDIYTSTKYPKLTVVSKPTTGRADSLNVGVNLACSPLVCVIDPGYVLARDGLSLLAKPFIEYPHQTLISATTGEIETGEDGPENHQESLQLVVRKRLFHGSYFLREQVCVATGLESSARMLRKSDLIEMGGFQESSVIGDLQVNLYLQKGVIERGKGYRVSYVPDILCWRMLGSDSVRLNEGLSRWQASAMQAVVSNLSLLWQPRLVFGYLLLLLECYTPLLELLGLLLAVGGFALGLITTDVAMLYMLTLAVFALLESMSGIVADEFSLRHQHTVSETISLTFSSLIDAAFYRQAVNFWRLRGALRMF
ncbi:MAG: glycosyltransferase family 2 protein, partial [Candidatus Bathyarchaeia archaeon]